MKKIIFVCICVLLLMLPMGASANMAEGPRLVILAIGGPGDLTITLAGPEGSTVLQGTQIGYEKHFVLDYLLPGGPYEMMELRGTGVNWDIPMQKAEGYNRLVTLDVKNRKVIPGQPPWRQPLLVGTRVVFTLLIEGVVFYLFGYRQKWSWAIFILTNLLTQTGLNLLIALAEYDLMWGFGLFVYFVAEPLIFFAEALVYVFVLREKSWKRDAVCAVTANAASLLFGLLLFAVFPI